MYERAVPVIDEGYHVAGPPRVVTDMQRNGIFALCDTESHCVNQVSPYSCCLALLEGVAVNGFQIFVIPNLLPLPSHHGII